MVMLNSQGITESIPQTDTEGKPFDLPGDDVYINTKLIPPTGAPDLLTTLQRWAEMQRDAYAYLATAFVNVPAGLSVVTASGPSPVAQQQFPDDLLSKPLENIRVSDERLGIPQGCITVLEQAGICSVAMLLDRMSTGEITRIPRVGKAKASVIRETMRAFLAAVELYSKRDD